MHIGHSIKTRNLKSVQINTKINDTMAYQNSRLWTLDSGLWTLNSVRWTLNVGLWKLYATLRKLGSGHLTLLSTGSEQN